MTEHETHAFDVVVIGAGGAGLRAAIEASDQGARTALVCKSLLGKAHTVMAEGGIAAAMGNVYPDDNWRVHFRGRRWWPAPPTWPGTPPAGPTHASRRRPRRSGRRR